MRYKGRVANIKQILTNHKVRMDDIINRMAINKAEVDRNIEDHKAMWTDEYKETYRKEHTNTDNLREKVEASQGKAKEKLDSELVALEKEIRDYFLAPARSNFVSTLMGYRDLGVQLSKDELKAIAENVNSYSEARMIAQFSDNYVKENPNYFNNDVLDRILDPITLPDYDTTMKAFGSFKETAQFLISDYCGTQAQGFDLVKSAGDRVFSVNADAFLRGNAAEDFCKALEACNDVLPLEVRNKLTKEELALIDSALPDYENYPNLSASQAREIASKDAYMYELLQLDPRYSEAMKGVEYAA